LTLLRKGKRVQEGPPPKANSKPRRGTETRQKSVPVTTRYSPAEFAQLDEAASRAGLTRASFQRVQSLGTPPKTRSTRRAPIERELLAKALGQLGKVGSNLNQLAHAANLDGAERVEAMLTIAALRELLPVFMEALGRKP
jgi:hypothetical protein